MTKCRAGFATGVTGKAYVGVTYKVYKEDPLKFKFYTPSSTKLVNIVPNIPNFQNFVLECYLKLTVKQQKKHNTSKYLLV